MKCCGFAQYGMELRWENKITTCPQVGHVGGGQIYLLEDFETNKIDINVIIAKRKEILEHFRTGKIYPNCEGCMDLKDVDNICENPKIRDIILQYWTKCNSNCIYCYTAGNKKFFQTRKHYEFYPILKELIKQNLLDEKGGVANFSGGEVSCLKEFTKLVKLFEKINWFTSINSSGVKYESIIGERLKKGTTCIIISVDAGTKAVHEKIKQVKTYDKVWKNIEKYAKMQIQPYLVNVKYIIIPNINDSEEEIQIWLNKCKKANVHNVVLGIDTNYFVPNRNNIADNILNLFETTRQRAEEMGFTFYLGNRASNMLTVGKYADEKWEKYKFDESRYSDLYYNIKK